MGKLEPNLSGLGYNWRAFVNTVMNFQILQKAGKVLTDWPSVGPW